MILRRLRRYETVVFTMPDTDLTAIKLYFDVLSISPIHVRRIIVLIIDVHVQRTKELLQFFFCLYYTH